MDDWKGEYEDEIENKDKKGYRSQLYWTQMQLNLTNMDFQKKQQPKSPVPQK